MADNTLWSKGLPLDAAIHRFTVGDDPWVDLALAPHDALGSAAHARMLARVGLLPEADMRALVAALRTLHDEARAGAFTIRPEQEDGHTALEAALVERVGEPGRRIHLGRSAERSGAAGPAAVAARGGAGARRPRGGAGRSLPGLRAGPRGRADARLHAHAPRHAEHLRHVGRRLRRGTARGAGGAARPVGPA